MSLLFALILALGVAIPALGTCQEISIRRVYRIVYGPSPADHFRSPRGLFVDHEHGIIAVGDTGGHRLAFFDSLGRYRGAMSWGQDQRQPRSVAIDSRKRVFVLDAAGKEIEVLSPTGARVGRFEIPLPNESGDVSATSIQVGESGRIYALMTDGRAGIAVIASNGHTAQFVDFADVGAASFASPISFAVHPDERQVAILDQRATHQIKILSMDGTLLHDFGPHGEGPGTFAMAYSVTWGPQGSLWVVDTIRHTINVFDAEANYVGRLGGFGHGPGQLNYPAASAFLSDQKLVVLERSGNRFQVWGLEYQFLELSHARFEMKGSEGWGQFVQH